MKCNGVETQKPDAGKVRNSVWNETERTAQTRMRFVVVAGAAASKRGGDEDETEGSGDTRDRRKRCTRETLSRWGGGTGDRRERGRPQSLDSDS